jgi:hypothetical protein
MMPRRPPTGSAAAAAGAVIASSSPADGGGVGVELGPAAALAGVVPSREGAIKLFNEVCAGLNGRES